jgi:acetylornithine deacetylase/succinyl-diaminopimelate desuccinylase-like protein
VVAALEAQCRQLFSRIAAAESEAGCTVSWTPLVDSPAVRFHPDCIAAVQAAAEDACTDLASQGVKARDGGTLWKHMVSGAGHDSSYTNKRVPTSMIFAVTREGVSHTPHEYCSPDDCAVGAQVLLGAVLRYDRARRKLS